MKPQRRALLLFCLILLGGLALGASGAPGAEAEPAALRSASANAGWEEIGGSASGGGISDNSGESVDPSLAIGPDGTPVVAWTDTTSGNSEIYLRRWNDTAWVELGGSATGGGISNTGIESGFPSLAIGHDGAAIVAWFERGVKYIDIYLRRWNGAAWVELGGSATGGGISDNSGDSSRASLAIGPDGAPVVAWHDDSFGDDEIYLRRWDGAAWVELGGSATGGGISDNSGDSTWLSLAIGPDGTPVVAWHDHSGGNREIYLRRWNGEITCYSLTIIVNGSGSVSAAPDLECYEDGAQVTLTATPTAGHAFAGWSGDLTGSANPVVLTMNADLSVTANFIHQCYTLSRSHTGSGGEPTAAPPNSTGCATGRYTSGQAISLSASPAAGWRVKNWSGTTNNGSTATTNSLTMPAANHTVSVAYEVIPATSYRAFMPQVVNVPLTCFAGPDEREPNNTGAAANGPLCPGVVFRGLPDDLWDIFYLETARAGDLTVTLTESFGGGMQLHLYTGAVGGSPYYQDTDDDDGLQAALRGAPAGRYYIAVYTETPNPAEIRRYNLRTTLP